MGEQKKGGNAGAGRVKRKGPLGRSCRGAYRGKGSQGRAEWKVVLVAIKKALGL